MVVDQIFMLYAQAMECSRRGCGEKYIIQDKKTRKPVDWKATKSNDSNKQQFIQGNKVKLLWNHNFLYSIDIINVINDNKHAWDENVCNFSYSPNSGVKMNMRISFSAESSLWYVIDMLTCW